MVRGRRLMGDVKHPAKFSNAVLDEINGYLARDHPPWSSVARMLYDPFAGVGKVFELQRDNLVVYGTEIEWEWASQYEATGGMICMDAFEFMASLRDSPGIAVAFPNTHGRFSKVPREGFDYIVTSPTYGNRMADHHEAKDGSKRLTYRHQLGRALTEGNSGGMQWGDEYREFHMRAWKACHGVTRKGGKILVNVKDHIRKGSRQLVVDFHIRALEVAGWKIVGTERVDTPGMKYGENGEVRVDGEWILIGEK